MQRVPEPELMLDPEQAEAYAAADFEDAHGRFITLLQERLALPEAGTALDLGAGPGDISFRFARAFPHWIVDAVDGSPAMLELGRRALPSARIGDRVSFRQALLPHGFTPKKHDFILSNSLLHHLAQPETLWSVAKACSHPTSLLFVMDLARPASPERARELVRENAAGEPEVLQKDFYNSLLAAYRPHEVRKQLRAAGLAHLTVETVSDRHLIVWGRLNPLAQ